ncbi:hypothetical protein CKCE_0220 [Candidatus Kinetoplastibacterium crithidii (ex Angomonas deanei ATCC 30255)]|nr:hypothetical protein CKCE_0220 [Candidatus Kinetoplastibacterium crithidii (ex Angomonas deanei ATCC 30255)]
MIVLEEVLRLAHPIIPFITEELWQKVSLFFNDYHNKNVFISISTQEYPKENRNKINLAIEKDFIELKSQIDAVRTLRGAMNLSPADKIPLLAKGNITKLKRNSPYIMHFAKLKSIDIVNDIPKLEAPVQIVGETYLMLDIKIDINLELLRLEKEQKKLMEEIDKCNLKLQNSNFMKNAPEHIIDQEKNRLEKFQLTINNVSSQIDKIKKHYT